MIIKKKCNCWGILTILGGFLMNLCFGSIFLWGNINGYIVSYFRNKDGDL